MLDFPSWQELCVRDWSLVFVCSVSVRLLGFSVRVWNLALAV